MFSVRWAPSTLNDFDEFWTDTDETSRRIIIDAVSDIHDVLKTHAESAGESRDPGIRVLLVAPLGIEY